MHRRGEGARVCSRGQDEPEQDLVNQAVPGQLVGQATAAVRRQIPAMLVLQLHTRSANPTPTASTLMSTS